MFREKKDKVNLDLACEAVLDRASWSAAARVSDFPGIWAASCPSGAVGPAETKCGLGCCCGVSDCTAWAASCSGGFQQEPIGRRAVLAELSVQQEPSALVRAAVLLLQE